MNWILQAHYLIEHLPLLCASFLARMGENGGFLIEGHLPRNGKNDSSVRCAEQSPD